MKKSLLVLIGVFVFLGLIVLIGFLTSISTYNKMVQYDEAVTSSWSQVENVYQRRADLIPNLVNTVKGYADFEQETLTQVIEARSKATSVNINAENLNEQTLAQFQQAQDGLSSALSRLLVVVEKYPELKICGYRNGYFDLNNDLEVLQDIIYKKTELLIVGMGVPRQELWLAKNKDRLAGVKISIAGGAILDFISENVSRAPKWMRKTGTEWVFRLLQEPARLFQRYAIGIPLFYYFIYKLKK